jgi:hypothetical protein
MVGAFDAGAPTRQVNVYEEGKLITQVACESPEEAAEPEDALVDDDYRSAST